MRASSVNQSISTMFFIVGMAFFIFAVCMMYPRINMTLGLHIATLSFFTTGMLFGSKNGFAAFLVVVAALFIDYFCIPFVPFTHYFGVLLAVTGGFLANDQTAKSFR